MYSYNCIQMLKFHTFHSDSQRQTTTLPVYGADVRLKGYAEISGNAQCVKNSSLFKTIASNNTIFYRLSANPQIICEHFRCWDHQATSDVPLAQLLFQLLLAVSSTLTCQLRIAACLIITVPKIVLNYWQTRNTLEIVGNKFKAYYPHINSNSVSQQRRQMERKSNPTDSSFWRPMMNLEKHDFKAESAIIKTMYIYTRRGESPLKCKGLGMVGRWHKTRGFTDPLRPWGPS